MLQSFSHLQDVVSKSAVAPYTSATRVRILDGITAEDVANMLCDMCFDVVRKAAWSFPVVKRVTAKAMPLMSKTNVVGHARQVTATRCKCFSCARSLVLIMPALMRSEQRASRSLRKSANVSRNWAIMANGGKQSEILSGTQKARIKQVIQHVRARISRSSGQDVKKQSCEQTRYDVQNISTSGPKDCVDL